MRIIIEPEITSDVFIITPKNVSSDISANNDIEYYHFSPKEKHDFVGDEQIKERIIEEYWYRYYYKDGDKNGELLCYDDSLVILYGIPERKKTNVQFSLSVIFQTNLKLSDYPVRSYFYYKYGSDYKSINEGRSFSDFVKYSNTDYLESVNRYDLVKCEKSDISNTKKVSEYSLYVQSMNYYHQMNKGYDWNKLNDLLYYIFGENMKEEDFEKYKNMEHYNQTYYQEGI